MNRQKTVIIGLIVAVVAVAGLYMAFAGPGSTGASINQVEEIAATEPAAADTEAVASEETAAPATETMITETASEAPAAAATIDVQAALAERSMGSADAPIVIHEYAALSCSHCADFYKETLPKLKEAYIDTGKVRLVYNDFPFNGPALAGAMIARCMPQDQYFKFIKFLFETQEQWAYTQDFQKNLTQSAKLLGASDAMLEACLANEELKGGLIERMQKASTEFKIESTPSFVVNGGKEVIKGAQKFEAFQKVIDKLLAESNSTE